MKFLQKLGKAIMLPVACMPLCGILMGIGYFLCPFQKQKARPTKRSKTPAQRPSYAWAKTAQQMA